MGISITVCLFVRLRISPPRIKLASSHFVRRFIGVQGRESHILGNFAFPEAKKSDESRVADSSDKDDATFVEYRTAYGRRIGMCGYTAVPGDVLVYCICTD